MNNYLTLTKVLLKTSLSSISEKEKKKQRWAYVVLAICLIPSLFAFTFMFREMILLLEPFHQSGYIYSIGLQSASTMILIFSTFLIPSIYYFSKDIDHLLPLPLSSECIIAAKFTVSVVYEYLFCAMILIPLYIAFALSGYTDIMFWIINIIVFITIPIYPLVLSSIVIVIIMRFVPMVRRKDLFNTVGSLILVAFSLAFSLYISSAGEMDSSQMTDLLLNGNNSLLGLLSYLYPHITLISQALFLNKYINVILYFLLLIVAIAVFLAVSKAFYLKGALSIEETNSKRVKLTDKQLTNQSKQQNVLLSYTIKELRLLLRTPAYMMNCVITEFIFPIALIIGIISGGGEELIPLLTEVIPQIDHLFAYLIIIGVGIGMMASNTSMVSATSISREGTGYIFMKYIPVPLRTIFNAKVLSGFVIAQIMIVFVYVGLFIILPSPFIILLSFIGAEVGAMIGSYVGLIIDVIHPNLYWEEETAAVKRSVSGMVSMFVGFGVMALFAILCFVIPSSMIDFVAILVLVLLTIICILLYSQIDIILEKSFRKL